MKNLLDILAQEGKLNPEQVQLIREEAKSSNRKEEEVLLEKKLISEIDLFRKKSEILKVPFTRIDFSAFSSELFRGITEEALTQYRIMPLARKEGTLEIGMLDPENPEAKDAINFIVLEENLTPKIFLITPSDFKEALKRFKSLREEVKSALRELEVELKAKKQPKRKKMLKEEAERIVAEAPITKMVAVILRHAVEGKASDIHIEPGRESLKVRFRVDGILYATLFLPLHVHPAVVSRIKILSNLKIDETRIPQDGRFRAKIAGREIDFRVSTFPTTEGEKVAMRILDPSTGLLSLPELGLESRNLETAGKGIKKPFGMVLISGPTGSGKTTTLYAIMRILNNEEVNIMSLEDPVEYHIEGINQSQVKPEIKYDFAQGLRHMVRQDPDIIMVGEIRDNETATLATHAALTGHIVLSTIHTNNAVGIIPRLLDMGIDSFLIPPSLSLGIAQRLVRKLCDHCKLKVKPSKRAEDIILKEIEDLPEGHKEKLKTSRPIEIYQAQGCKECFDKGTSGRIALFEVLEMTPQLEKIIIEKPAEAEIEKEAKRQGMITMKQDGILKVLRGITSLEEVLKVVE